MQRHNTEHEVYLTEWTRLEQTELRGEYGLTDIRIDYERILSSGTLTPRDRQVCVMYLCNLSQSEMAVLLDISQQALSKRVHTCLQRLIPAMMGLHNMQPQEITNRTIKLMHPDWDKWMVDVLHNNGKWWRVPESVRRFVQQRLGVDGLSPRRADYDKQGNEYPIRFERSYLGRDRTFTGQAREVNFDDAIGYGEVNFKVGLSAYPKYPNDSEIKKDKGGSWWAAI